MEIAPSFLSLVAHNVVIRSCYSFSSFKEYSTDCKFAPGGVFSVVAAGFFYLVSTILCCFPNPRPVMESLKKDKTGYEDDPN